MVETVETFPAVDSKILNTATEKALAALSDENTPQKLAAFYNPEKNFAGATFAGLEPNAPDRITATDLLAITTLSVDIPVRAVRRFLQDPAAEQALTEKLQALPAKPLELTTASDFELMEDFYGLAKNFLARADTTTSNPWVTASKLVARKRADLFPVRDSVVCDYLEIRQLRDCTKDWFVFRTLMNTQSIQEELKKLPKKIKEAAGSSPVELDQEPLRLLDAALWRYGA